MTNNLDQPITTETEAILRRNSYGEAATAIRALLEERSTDKATISALEAENKRLREANAGLHEVIEPFTSFAEDAVEQVDSWTWKGLQNDRIRDWFGPSDFGAARDISRNRRES